jgi:hypothetical protein
VQAVQRERQQGAAEEVVLPIVTIEIHHDKVVIERIEVPRPVWLAASIWIRYWEQVNNGTYEEGYSRGFNDGLREGQDERFRT